jgi:Contractile injection system tube protein
MATITPGQVISRLSVSVLNIVALEGDLPEVPVYAHPAEVRIDKMVVWTKQPTSISDSPHLQFSSAEGRTLQMELLFDNTSTKTSVEPAIAGLFAMAEIMDTNSSESMKRPPLVALRWADNTLAEMKGVIQALSARYVEFTPKGLPIKAEVALTFREASQVSFKHI